MANITAVLNDQIRRLARREIRSNTKVVRRATAQYRRDIAALKRQVADLSKTISFLTAQEKRRGSELPAAPEQLEGLRFRADGLRTHRAKLGLSAEDYGRLVGVSGQTIYNWEAGDAKPRTQQLAMIASARGIGKREALRRLELLGGAPESTRRSGQTAREFILSLVKSKKATTTSAINDAWKAAGRPGVSNNTLTLLTKQGELKRRKLDGKRGSDYYV